MIGKKLWSVIHFLILCLLLVWNYIAQSGSLPYNMGELSAKYPTLFTPASYAFAIWGVIYLGLMVLGIYMIYCVFKKDKEDAFVVRSAPYLSTAYFFMIHWIWFWGNDQVFIALIMMILILSSLIAGVLRLRMELWDAPVQFMAFVWWPIDLLFGWICVATIANVTIYLDSIDWQGWGLSEVSWTYIMIGVVTILGLVLIAARNMREVGAVFIWALIAIAVRNWDVHQDISIFCFAGVTTLAIYSTYHALSNAKTLPHNKMKRGEW